MGILAYNPKGFFAKLENAMIMGLHMFLANNFEVPIIPRSFSIREFHFALRFYFKPK
jgi:hypothetical protein